MRILIVSAYFHPFTHPRAHRWTEIAANWAAAGHEVHVVTAKNPSQNTLSEVRGATVHRAGFASLKEAFNYFFTGKIRRGELTAAAKKGGAKNLTRALGFLNDLFWRPFYWPDDAALWYFPARKLARELVSKNSFDAIVTVSMPFTGHLVGLFLKRKLPGTCWLVDIGDPVCFQRFPVQNPFFYRKLTRKFEKRVLLEADLVSVTNTGLVEVYQKNYGIAGGNIFVLPPVPTAPNIDGAAFSLPVNQHTSGGASINIGYFGTFFRGVREPDILVDLIKAVPPDWQGRLRFHVFGAVFHEFDAKLSGLPGLEIHGLVPRDRVFSEMRKMDFLLNVGNADAHQLPSKLADYLLSGLPIINLCEIENDSFAAASIGHPLMINLKKTDGQFELNLIGPLINFIETNRGIRVPDSFLEKQKHFFSAERIGAEYLKLIEKGIKSKKAKTS